MFLKIAGAYSAEQSGIRGVKTSFDPNINFKQLYNLTYSRGRYDCLQHDSGFYKRVSMHLCFISRTLQ